MWLTAFQAGEQKRMGKRTKVVERGKKGKKEVLGLWVRCGVWGCGLGCGWPWAVPRGC